MNNLIPLSAGAENIVKNARVVDSFDEAVDDCSLVIGTSARLRHLQNTLIEPRGMRRESCSV